MTLSLPSAAARKPNEYTKSNLIEDSSIIAIVSLGEPQAIINTPEGKDTRAFGVRGKLGSFGSYYQKASMKVEQVIKGDLPDGSVLHGGVPIKCAGWSLSKGKFLVFLRKDQDKEGKYLDGKDMLVSVNSNYSLISITKDKVKWYDGDKDASMQKSQNVENVVKEIQKHLDSKKSPKKKS